MAKRKSQSKQSINMTLSVGDRVTIASATIFDSTGTSSDMLATGSITKVDPMSGWDYEVTFDQELSLGGREAIKSRLYNRHQLIKEFDSSIKFAREESELGSAIRFEDRMTYDYNCAVRYFEDICDRMKKSKDPERIAELNIKRLEVLTEISQLEQGIKDARKSLVNVIRKLLAECPDDKTPV